MLPLKYVGQGPFLKYYPKPHDADYAHKWIIADYLEYALVARAKAIFIARELDVPILDDEYSEATPAAAVQTKCLGSDR